MMEKVHYVYRWDRIFGAIATLLLLLSAVFYVVYSPVKTEKPLGPAETPFISSNQETAPQDHSHLDINENSWMVTDNQQSSNPPLNMPENGPSPSHKSDHLSFGSAQTQPIVLEDTSEENSMPALKVEGEPPPPVADTEQPSISHEPVAIALYGPDTKQLSLPDQLQPEMPQTPEQTAIAQPSEPAMADILHGADNNKTFHLQKINRFSPAVKRFTLARAIKNKEPIGTVDSISMDAKGVAIIYAFSEIGDMRDRMLYYYWYHEGERVAKVPVHIGTDRWRSNSSKYINNKMQGEWLVELHADDDQILASAKFFNSAQ